MAKKYKTRAERRRRRHQRLRNKIAGTATRPRMAVCRTDHHLYVQIIDDDAGRTLAATSTLDKEVREQNLGVNKKSAEFLGQRIAEKILTQDIQSVVFDRGGFQYHGRVQAIAEGARKAGLKL